MKNLNKAKKLSFNRNSKKDIWVGILKIDQKRYIQDFLNAKKMTLYYICIFLLKLDHLFL